MSDEPAKVTALFGNYVPSAGTLEVLIERCENAVKAMRERKMVACAAVLIDEEGQAHLFFGHDPLRNTVLTGGIEILKQVIIAEIIQNELRDVTPSPKEPTP